MDLEEIKIKTFKEKAGMFSAVVNWDDGTEHATQGQNYPELMKNIADLLFLKMEEDEE